MDGTGTSQLVYYVLFADGTWAGGFAKQKDAEICQRKNGGMILTGGWFTVSQGA